MTGAVELARAWKYRKRLKADFQKTFESAEGKHVLIHLYTHLCGKDTTLSKTYDTNETHVNIGKRQAWLIILEFLKEDDQDMRKALEDHIAERKLEEEFAA